MDFGISTCFAVSVVSSEIENSAFSILKAMNYYGFAEVELCMMKRKRYNLIDFNPRTWKWHSIANILGINLITQLIDYLDGKQVEVNIVRKGNLGWIERVTDFYVVFTEVLKGKYPLYE